jgi:3,4-dihydroxy-2-butanone 4-phosphate synthase
MTNNPRKINRLTSLGVQVYVTIPMVVLNVINEYNRHYMETKKQRMNHQSLGDILRQDLLVSDINDKIAEDTLPDIHSTLADPTATATATVTDATTTTTSDNDNNNIHLSSTLTGVSAQEDGFCFVLQSVEDAIAAIASGDMVCVVDDMDNENEGDFIMAAGLCTPEAMTKIIRFSSGVICIAMEGSRMDELGLPPI